MTKLLLDWSLIAAMAAAAPEQDVRGFRLGPNVAASEINSLMAIVNQHPPGHHPFGCPLLLSCG